MGFVNSTFQKGFAGQSYAQWALFLFLFVFLWGVAISGNAVLRRATNV